MKRKVTGKDGKADAIPELNVSDQTVCVGSDESLLMAGIFAKDDEDGDLTSKVVLDKNHWILISQAYIQLNIQLRIPKVLQQRRR